jgi:hypothetical protein
MPRISEQVEWLSLVDISGPFLASTLLEQVFPQGLEKVETPRRQRIRSAYEEWRDAVDGGDIQLLQIHAVWVLIVLQDMLEYEDSVLMSGAALDGRCSYRAPESSTLWIPDYVIVGDDGKYRMLVSVWPPETDLEKVASCDSWPASPLDRMTLLCRANDVRLGLVTDGERWMVVNAPIGSTSGYAAWLARLWWQEPVTLKAFQSLLGVRRCFGPSEDTLVALLSRSAEFQEEVTDTLGEQVRRAVEILVQSIGRADQDRNGALLESVRPAELYEAGLTVMMRMVFTLCAEERDLLLLGDPIYDQHYAISTLRTRLREDADRLGIEVLERRHDAWSRILAVFRAIYGGVEHEALRMPAMGGSLFDPDRFPFLEGRAKGTTWREGQAVPLPIDNRTVLLLLDALQVLEQRAGAQLLSYRALDVEQIGHVYEGLLEYTVAKLDSVTVGLIGSQKVRHPSITLTELESLKSDGSEEIVESLSEMTGRSAAAIRRAVDNAGDDDTLVRLVHTCGGDEKLARQLLPFGALIRADSWDTMLVYKPGSFAVVHGSDRRETGTHYTPKSLTESIVEKTLEPIVYSGPADGEARERWKLKTPAEILDLKVCDPAMGSGAFLVQVCRYLADRLVEAWAREERSGKAITTDGIVIDTLGMADPLPNSPDERIIAARRLISERCLYGVDINPLAVELAKLSIWLVTMAKGRPFGFLDHNLRSGDSLLGIHRLDQLTKLTMNPDENGHQQRLFGQNIQQAVEEAVAIRAKLRAIPIRSIRDIETMARLDSEVRKKLETVELVADAMIGIVLYNGSKPRTISSALDALAVEAGMLFNGFTDVGKSLERDACKNLYADSAKDKPPRKPFHWPLEFPEVFLHSKERGFHALVGNPPYINAVDLYGDALSDSLKKYYAAQYTTACGSYDIYVIFWERSVLLSTSPCAIGLLVPNKLLSAEYAETLRLHLISHSRIYAIIDFSLTRAFAAGVYPICCIVTQPKTDHKALIVLGNGITTSVSQAALRNAPSLLWGYALTDYADLLAKALEFCVPLQEVAKVIGAATVAEAYEIAKIVVPNNGQQLARGHKRFVVSGNIRPFRTTWEISPVQYIKHRYLQPSVPLSGLPSDTRRQQAESPKIIISGMSKRPTAFCDAQGDYCAGKSTVLIMKPRFGGVDTLVRLTQVLNSSMAALIYKALYGGLALAGGYLRFGPPQLVAFPVPRQLTEQKSLSCASDEEISDLYGVDHARVLAAFSRTFSATVDSDPNENGSDGDSQIVEDRL